MLLDGTTGDHSCFSCGYVDYPDPLPPIVAGTKLDRRPTHAGQNLG